MCFVLSVGPPKSIILCTCIFSNKTCTLNTIHYGGNIHHFFYIFGYLLFFPKYMKNKIGILENDIYIFPIVNGVILLFY